MAELPRHVPEERLLETQLPMTEHKTKEQDEKKKEVKRVLSSLLCVPLDDLVAFPNMNITISVEVGDEERVLLVPRHEGEYAKVGTVAEVGDRVRLPGGGRAVNLDRACTARSQGPRTPTHRETYGSRWSEQP